MIGATGPRRRALLAIAVAAPTVLLGAGWLAASVRERESLEREQRTALLRASDAVAAAVDESLEELRRREDAQPFYLYNHLYVPSDVVALSDPVAVSPLARAPDDPRVIGHFQIDPDGRVRTPYAALDATEPPERTLRVVSVVQAEAFAPLRALAREAGVAAASAPAEPTPPARPRRRAPPPPVTPEPTLEGNPLVTDLDLYSQAQYRDIQAAQAGSVAAAERVQSRGRLAPVTRRNVVEWEGVEPQAPSQAQATRPRPPRQQRPEPLAPAPRESADAGAPAIQPEAEVDYTTMAWRRIGDVLVLHRVVSDKGVSVVQGLLLDRPALLGEWLPAIVRRHAGAAPAPSIVTGDARCALRRPASRILEGVDLCFPPGALATAGIDADLRLQAAALAGLLVIVALALASVWIAARRADDLAAQKSRFVAAVSHELRTPLTTLRMHAEMLEADLVSEERRPRVHAELVAEAIRLGRLVDNVLEAQRLEEGRRPLRLERVDVAARVRDLVERQRPLASGRGFALIGPAADGEPVEADVDPEALERIVVNLIDNALKYGGGDERRIEVAVVAEPERAVVRVRDSGPGIPAAERERVFERFHRVERAETAHAPGTGLGLWLVRDLARAHGGDAEAQEAPGGGAEIRVVLLRHA